jgi:hypothetical protein
MVVRGCHVEAVAEMLFTRKTIRDETCMDLCCSERMRRQEADSLHCY